jgi:membrane associated rhomboid family serine protease
VIILPWKVDVPFERLPVTNWLLIASVAVVFILEMAWLSNHSYFITDIDPEQEESAQSDPTPFDPYVMRGFSNIRGLFGHMWLHDGFLHIFGNMLFLWIFGNAVCQKIGNGIYLPVYLLAGLAAATGQRLFSEHPMIGASGAVNGIVGMYLVFFPMNDITCLFSLFPMVPLVYAWGFRSITVSGIWVILLWLAFDIYRAMAGGGPVAYIAHLGGFAAGFGLGFLLLLTKQVKMERYERSLLQIIRREPPMIHKPPQRVPWKPDGDYVEEELDPECLVKPMKLRDLEGGDAVKGAGCPKFTSTPYIEFTCRCGQRIRTPSINIGRSGLCPRCQTVLRVPPYSDRIL